MNSDKTFTEITQHGDQFKLSHNYPHRPSWKTHGEGRAIVVATISPKWKTIDLQCVEVPEGGRGNKVVFVSVPTEQVVKLLEKVGYKVTKP